MGASNGSSQATAPMKIETPISTERRIFIDSCMRGVSCSPSHSASKNGYQRAPNSRRLVARRGPPHGGRKSQHQSADSVEPKRPPSRKATSPAPDSGQNDGINLRERLT